MKDPINKMLAELWNTSDKLNETISHFCRIQLIQRNCHKGHHWYQKMSGGTISSWWRCQLCGQYQTRYTDGRKPKNG